ncbi:PRC-barrel domain-containing protein [Bizionia arctica]|uniref:PRC-barrel domain-containing protein n=1 Tax=Bizionia arctica TaxID=1495645 RepID=A0A917GDB8_9FLAO|nr:PRC-barrel domain-containing protein [Bizionia arctica]GGG39761.1 hypothetical protein GCM10010976_09270 [Bizionia arctica]
MTEHKKHLYYMNELSDYKISEGYPDVRGWDVKDFNNRVIGKVDNLLVNPEAERVVYLDVEVDKSIIDAKHDPYGRPSHVEVREFVNKDGENHIIIPIGLADLNTDSKYVYTDILDHQTFSETKRYRKGDNVNRDYEMQVLNSYERRTSPKENDNIIIGNDEVNFGEIPNEARIRKIVREEIRAYHNIRNTGDLDGLGNSDVDETVIFTDDESEIERRQRNNHIYDDDRFYQRKEFDDEQFRKNRNPRF